MNKAIGPNNGDKAKDSLIREYYTKQAEKFGADGRSTISDINTRNLEINALLNYLENGKKVLEIGCGNGYSAIKIIEQRNIDLVAIDTSEEMIMIAKGQTIGETIGRVHFEVGNVLHMNFTDKSFDAVFTERCLININDWEEQKRALSEINRGLKDNGLFIMLEAFTDGWRNMNEARQELGLQEIPQPWHNLFFDKDEVLKFVEGKFELLREDNFLSTYYFGSRILYPVLLPKGQEPRYDSKINSFFTQLPSFGNHAPIKILAFRKVGSWGKQKGTK